MATIDEEMSQLEKDIRQLKIEYDQFFGGGRKLQQKEEGKVQRHFGAAAKAIEAERSKAAAAAKSSAPQPTSFRMVCSEPEQETDKVDQLYQAFQQATVQTGGSIKQSRESFNEFVSKKTKELQKQKNCREVEYVVE